MEEDIMNTEALIRQLHDSLEFLHDVRDDTAVDDPEALKAINSEIRSAKRSLNHLYGKISEQT